MPRRHIVRTPEEEAEFQRLRRQRNAQNNLSYRRRLRDATDNFISNNNNTTEPISSSSEHGNNMDDSQTITQNENELQQINNISVQNNNSLINQNVDILNRTVSRGPIVRSVEDEISFQRASRERHVRNSLAYRARQLRNEDDNREHYIGKMDVLCVHCSAKHFAAEKVSNRNNSFSDCCSHGEAVLADFPEFPSELKSLFIGTNNKSNEFFQNIRSYNNSFAFASFNANLVNFPNSRRAPYCFKIQGQIYYQINTSIYPEENTNASYGQLFIIDNEQALTNRLNNNSANLDPTILGNLDNIMRAHNIFAQSYMMMNEELIHQERINGNNEDELRLTFSLKPGVDIRRYNPQRSNEVAAVFSTNADGEIPESYVSIRNRNTKELKTLSSMDPNVEPWLYPLLYPHGTRGWHRDMMRLHGNRRVTRSAYLKYHMGIRESFNPIIRGRRLFQQWVVDNYVKIEKDRVKFCYDNQKKLRADTYQGLQDYLRNAAIENNYNVGKVVILPSSFTGSPRNMMQNYQDSMAICTKYGPPDIFVTMTCNPQWKEIKENLLPGQQTTDRPDIVARVFDIKKKHLIDLIVKKQIFGPVEAHVSVIEFQKRNLPHIHLLVTLKPNNKIKTAEVVDKYISAEIPNPVEDPILHDIVMKNMIHGPCGDWCEVNGKCSKKYPKQFQDQTSLEVDGYPSYRRKNTGIEYERPNNFKVDNRNVVPYCPELSKIFNCHLNVELVSTINAVKYLYKYIYKGHDAANIIIHDSLDHDEIRNFLEGRYVGTVEAVWRILFKKLQQKSHSIVRLPIHLPNSQRIILPENNDESLIQAALDQTTMLFDYFKLNARDDLAKQLNYTEIPNHFVFKKTKVNGINVCRWERRQRQENSIGRLYSVSPTNTELYHLRLLLLSVKGATSFQNIREVNGEIFPTYVEACIALGLVEDDDEWKRCLAEAKIWMMPRRLRSLFARILIHCQPYYPELLWDTYKNALSEDYSRNFELAIAHKKAYASITKILEKEGLSLSDFPTMDQTQYDELVEEENTIDSLELSKQMYDKTNADQKKIIENVLYALDDNNDSNSKCFYIDGPGGSGKTFVYKTLYHLLKSKNIEVTTMAFTGIAATLLPNGKTVHKTFGLSVPLYSDSTSNITIQSKEGQDLKKTQVFIWDEAPMAPRYALEIMDRTLKDIMHNDNPFGGKIIILGGDFRQLLPIKVRGTRSEIVNLSIKFSCLWKHFKTFKLITNMRALPEEIEFSQFLLNVGNGTINDNNDNIILPEKCIANPNYDIVQDTYASMIQQKQYHSTTKCAILSARNVDVNEINKRVVSLLDKNTEKIYYSIDSTEKSNDTINECILPEYLNTLEPSSLPPHELRLRKYSIVMLIRNLSINEGLCNGTRLLVLELSNYIIKCEILTGDKSGDITFLNRISLKCENEYPFAFSRRQFPVRLAFAMTINKSQGQTFEKIAIDLRKDVFNHGQLYVALSRTRCWEAIKLYLGSQRSTPVVKNYVYKELFS